MKSLYLAVLIIGISIFLPSASFVATRDHDRDQVVDTSWTEKGVHWLIRSQSENGGWGTGSFMNQSSTLPHGVQTDPATTAFAAMALMEAGGSLPGNPYRREIRKALDRILDDIDHRPGNGRLTSLEQTQTQRKLGMNIDISMALDFLTSVRKQIQDEDYEVRIDSAASICIKLLESNQNPNGSWNNGGWAPVLQSAMANNALENAKTQYAISDSVQIRGARYQSNNYFVDGIRISNDDAGIPLYNAVSAQRVTAGEAKEAEELLNLPATLSEVVIVDYKTPLIEQNNTTSGALEARGIDKAKARRLAKAYDINTIAKKELQNQEVWEGFGSNGGEEFLSHKLHSEALEKQNQVEWLAWRKEIEPKFKHVQNPNGSWSGHHCITSPVFCTAAVLLAWYGNESPSDLSVEK